MQGVKNSMIILFCLAVSAGVSGQDRPAGENRKDPETIPAKRGQSKAPQGIFKTDVPDHPQDVILFRPTATSITLSVLSNSDERISVSYGTEMENLARRTEMQDLRKGIPKEIVLSELKPNTQYFYQLMNSDGKTISGFEQIRRFHTQRAEGSDFIFTVQADSHLDENTSPDLYRLTLGNALADSPDFHIDLGDTFMTDKHASRETAARQYQAQRYYFSLIGHSAPVFIVLGNHDGEDAKLLRGGADSLAVWSNTMRKKYFLNPIPDDFYSGNSSKDQFAGLLQDYYSWQWGDALFVVLDPFWYASAKRTDDCWNLTLGDTQYKWLKNTLEKSKARFKFIFIHNLSGGLDKQGRGGSEAVPFGEWGGKNPDRSDGFKEHRPTWEEPVHQMLVNNHVTAVFHGHDHLFAKQDVDGIVYQEVPQPGCPGTGGLRSAKEYGYIAGEILPGSGHLRINVSKSSVKVDFIRALLPKDETGSTKNGSVAHSYKILLPTSIPANQQDR